MNSDEIVRLNEEFQKLTMKVNLDGVKCCLWHEGKLPDAVDYIIQDVGYREEVMARLAIPICQECLEAISSGDWILMYCVNCNQSRWVNKHLTKRLYLYEDAVNNILWMSRCPECTVKA